MFTVTLETLGTAITFFSPKRFIIAAVVSFRYFSCILLFISILLFFPVFRCSVLLVQTGSATLATAGAAAVSQVVVADAGAPAATAADYHHVGSVNAGFLFDDAALDIFPGIRASMALDDVGMLDDHGVFPPIDGQNPAAFSGVAPGHDFHLIAFAKQNREPLGFMCAHGFYQTSGASETILVNFLSRSSLATGPNTRVPTVSFASSITTSALSSKRM